MPRPDSDLDLFIDYDPEAKVPNMFRLMQIEEERGLSASR
jgi:predicted nucleotidyltransferase